MKKNTRTRQTGFTLIELMITVVILAILLTMAFPSYEEFVRKGKRAQGRTAIAELLLQQERYMTQRNCYLTFTTDASFAATATAPAPAGTCGGVTAASVPMKTFSGDRPGNSHYRLWARQCPATAGGTAPGTQDCVEVVATPLFADPYAGELRMTSTGRKSCGTGNMEVCWP